MNKKIMLLAVAAVSAVVLALPAMASAMLPLHTAKIQKSTVSGGAATLSKTGGTTVTCEKTTGTSTATTTTTGNLTLLFHGCKSSGITCTSPGQTAGTIETTALTYHLLTLTNKEPGILVTPNGSTGVFAHFSCSFLSFTVEGNGVLGTITSPKCGVASSTATMSFKALGVGVQQHTTVEGTATKYQLTSGGQNAAQEVTTTVTSPEADTLTCT
jgi:hypothetical protein